MSSIHKILRRVKTGIIVAQDKGVLRIGNDGVGLPPKSKVQYVPDTDHAPKRGKITTFSANSARRFRDALLRYTLPDSLRLAATFTVPWQPQNGGFNYCLDEWRETVKRFRSAFSYLLPQSAALYRCELQKRGAPHIHALIYLATTDLRRISCDTADMGQACPTPCLSCDKHDIAIEWVKCKIAARWRNSIHNLHGGRCKPDLGYGMKIDLLTQSGYLKYIADHSSKHKIEQLGYKGRQWGFIARKNLLDCQSELPFESDLHEAIFRRMWQRLTAYHKHQVDCPFGYAVARHSRNTGVVFGGSASTARLLFEHAAELAAEKLANRAAQNSQEIKGV